MNTTDRSPSVLVVEDESLVRMMAVDMFEEAGFHVLESSSGERALSVLKANPAISSLFTDIELSGSMNGVSLAKVVHDHYPDMAIIVVSGRASPLSDALPVKSRFIGKPYDLAHVLVTMKTLLEDDTHECER